MDEQQLAELFHDAADGGPAATFGHTDVVAASRRVTARRRIAFASGSTLGIVVLVGGIVIGSGLLQGSDRGGTQSAAVGGAGVESVAPPAVGDQPRVQAPGLAAPPTGSADQNGPELTAEQGRDGSGKVVPWPGLRDGDARAGCGPVDRELADVLIRELPATPQATVLPVPDACPPGARAAAVAVGTGSIYVVLAPVRGDGPADQFVGREDGAVGFSVYTPKGSVLLVLSVPATVGGQAPQLDRVQPLAETIGRAY